MYCADDKQVRDESMGSMGGPGLRAEAHEANRREGWSAAAGTATHSRLDLVDGQCPGVEAAADYREACCREVAERLHEQSNRYMEGLDEGGGVEQTNFSTCNVRRHASCCRTSFQEVEGGGARRG